MSSGKTNPVFESRVKEIRTTVSSGKQEGRRCKDVPWLKVQLSPVKAIHAHCRLCVGNPRDLKKCGGTHYLNGGCDAKGVCWLYPYRLGTGRPSVKIIRKWCLWCQGESREYVRECDNPSCPLYDFRMGTNPHRAEASPKSPQNDVVSGCFEGQNPRSQSDASKNTRSKKPRRKKRVSRSARPRAVSSKARKGAGAA
jgi:hypothetical protein